MESRDEIKCKDMEHEIYSEMERLWSESGQTFDNIFGVDKCTDMLIANIVQPFRFPHLYPKPVRAFTLFGLPGSGKTHLLSAAAKASGAKLFVLNVWNLKARRFVNDTHSVHNLLKTAFKVARDNSPSILCFEEIEVFSKDGMDAAKISFIEEVHHFLHNPQDIWDLVVLIGTSQAPWNVDSSVRELFTWSPASHVTLPDVEAKVKVLENCFENVSHSLGQEQFTLLASKSTGFTGCDLLGLARQAQFRPLRRLSEATHFKKILVKSESDVKKQTKSGNRGDKSAKPLERNSQSKQCSNENKTECAEAKKDVHRSLSKESGNQTGLAQSPQEEKGGDSFHEMFVPCSAEDAGAIAMSVLDIPEDKIQVSEVSMEDMEEELMKMRPMDATDVEKMLLFESEHCAG